MTFKEKWKANREERKKKRKKRKVGFFFRLILGGAIKRIALPIIKEKLKDKKIATEVINIVENSVKEAF